MRSQLILRLGDVLASASAAMPIASIVDALKDDSQPVSGERGFDFLKSRDTDAGKPSAGARPAPPTGRATPTAGRCRRLDKNVELAFDTVTLSDAATAEARIVVESNTDAQGSPAHKLAMSRRRAEAVVANLAEQGVSRDLMRARGLGFERLRVADHPTDPANRRVEVVRLL